MCACPTEGRLSPILPVLPTEARKNTSSLEPPRVLPWKGFACRKLVKYKVSRLGSDGISSLRGGGKGLPEMVGFFSRISSVRSGHRRTQSAAAVSQISASNADVLSSNLSNSARHCLEVALEFKPVEHPTEPLTHDQPVKCPLPEPSILNDGRIWKERMSANARVRADISVSKEGTQTDLGPQPARASIMPSYSAPEHNITTLLEGM